MKIRDIIKYAFAAFIAVATIVGIVGMEVARYKRSQLTEEEARRIQETLTATQQPAGLPSPARTPAPGDTR